MEISFRPGVCELDFLGMCFSFDTPPNIPDSRKDVPHRDLLWQRAQCLECNYTESAHSFVELAYWRTWRTDGSLDCAELPIS